MENTESTVKDRLIEFLKSENLSKSYFGRSIGVSSAFITSMRKSIQPDKIKSIALIYPSLNIDWLLTGEGEMLKSEVKKKSSDDTELKKKYDILMEKHLALQEKYTTLLEKEKAPKIEKKFAES